MVKTNVELVHAFLGQLSWQIKEQGYLYKQSFPSIWSWFLELERGHISRFSTHICIFIICLIVKKLEGGWGEESNQLWLALI